MQAIADTDLKFLDVSVGYPGSIHDSRVFSLSPIYQAMEQGLLMTGPTKIISGVTIRPLLAGDSAYPLTSCNRKRRLSRTQKDFKRKFSSARVVVERAFGPLKK